MNQFTGKIKNHVDVALYEIDNISYCWHNELTIIIVKQGTVKVRAWADDHLLHNGDFIVLNPKRVHLIEGITMDNLVAVIKFNIDYCEDVVEDFEEILFRCNSKKYGEIHKKQYDVAREHIEELILAAADEDIPLVDEKARNILKYISATFDFLTSGMDLKKFSSKICNRNKEIYRRLFLAGEYRDWSLKELADYIGINYSYLRSDVVKRFGFGYNWLKYSIIVDRASRMLLSSDYSVTEVKEHCGFSTHQYFIKYFKTYYGCTPSEFKNKHGKNKTVLKYNKVSLNKLF